MPLLDREARARMKGLPRHRFRRVAALAVGMLLLGTGCTSVGGAPDLSGAFSQGGQSSGGSDLPRRPRPAPQSGGDVLGTSDLHALYQAVIDVYVDQSTHLR